MMINFYPPPISGIGRDRPGSASDFLRRRWVRGAWRFVGWGNRLVFVLMILLWWPSTIIHAAYLAARLGPSRSRSHGKSPLRQFVEQLEVAAKWMIPPLWYYTFDFFEDERRAHAADYLQRVQTKPFIFKWLVDKVDRKDPIYPFADKLTFFETCRRHDLPTGTIIAVAGPQRIRMIDPAMTQLPPTDLFVKPKNGRGGRGAEKWSYVAGKYRDRDGRNYAVAELEAHLKQRARREKRLIQYCMTNHSALADLNLGALATTRILSLRNERGEIEVTHAVFRMPQRKNALVDNIHAGGIAASVDVATGRLGKATDLGVSMGSAWHDRHPETGAPIEGRILPLWAEVIALARRAHERIGDRVVIGWDIAILEDGPCIVEGNGKPDVDLMQRPHRTGLGNTRFGEILAYHLKRVMAGDRSNGRPAAEFSQPR
jgi:hypothetical protein